MRIVEIDTDNGVLRFETGNVRKDMKEVSSEIKSIHISTNTELVATIADKSETGSVIGEVIDSISNWKTFDPSTYLEEYMGYSNNEEDDDYDEYDDEDYEEDDIEELNNNQYLRFNSFNIRETMEDNETELKDFHSELERTLTNCKDLDDFSWYLVLGNLHINDSNYDVKNCVKILENMSLEDVKKHSEFYGSVRNLSRKLNNSDEQEPEVIGKGGLSKLISLLEICGVHLDSELKEFYANNLDACYSLFLNSVNWKKDDVTNELTLSINIETFSNIEGLKKAISVDKVSKKTMFRSWYFNFKN